MSSQLPDGSWKPAAHGPPSVDPEAVEAAVAQTANQPAPPRSRFEENMKVVDSSKRATDAKQLEVAVARTAAEAKRVPPRPPEDPEARMVRDSQELRASAEAHNARRAETLAKANAELDDLLRQERALGGLGARDVGESPNLPYHAGGGGLAMRGVQALEHPKGVLPGWDFMGLRPEPLTATDALRSRRLMAPETGTGSNLDLEGFLRRPIGGAEEDPVRGLMSEFFTAYPANQRKKPKP